MPDHSPAEQSQAELRAGRVAQGDIRAVSRLITQVQNGSEIAHDVLRLLYPRCGSARLIGITGPPGAGKSTLVASLIREFRRRDMSVGVLAVDPSSPFSGGAVLGDRDRMEGFASDDGVFIRSLASRGVTGGLCAAANDAVDILDAMGKDVVLVETVGVGQSEIEIARIADCVLLTLVPGYGDQLQAMKAGIMEVADILVMNKADCEGAEAAANALESQDYYHPVPEGQEMWKVPVARTTARRDEGIEELVSLILHQLEFALKTGWKKQRHRQRRTRQFLEILTDRIRSSFLGNINSDSEVQKLLDRIERMEIDPHTASAEMAGRFHSALDKS